MFRNDSDLLPLTYSVKSYRRRKSIGFMKVLLYTLLIALLLAAAGITVLSLLHMI